jgi:hypothetical protein
MADLSGDTNLCPPCFTKGVGGINIFSSKSKGVFGSHPSPQITRLEMLP